MDWFWRKLCKNFGKIAHDVYRSGQPMLFVLKIMNRFLKLRTIINLAYSPETDKQDNPEREWAIKKGIAYYGFKWGSGMPPGKDDKERMAAMKEVVDLMDSCKKPLKIGCEGGRDRTGGAAGCYRKSHGATIEQIMEDWEVYGQPASGYVEAILKY